MVQGLGLGLFRGFVGLVWDDCRLCWSVVEIHLLKVDVELVWELSWLKSEGQENCGVCR